MQRRILFLGLTAMALSACFASENPASGGDIALAAARAQVTQRLDTWLDATRSGDFDAAKDHWAADLRVQEAEFDLSGPAIVDFAREFFTTHRVTATEFSPTETVAHDDGAVVYQLGHYAETVEPKDGSAPAATVRNNFIARWVRGDDGTFRLHRFFGTPQPKEPRAAAVAAQPVNAAVGSIEDRLARQQITQLVSQYAASIRANDEAAIAAFWEDDASFFEPGVEQIGKPLLTQFLTRLLAENRVTDADPKIQEIFVHDSGSIAYVYGSVVEVLETMNGQAEATTTRLNIVLRWRRGADGDWRIDRIYGTPQPRATSPL